MYPTYNRIYADFNNVDKNGLIRLNAHGTIKDITDNDVTLQSGIKLLLDDNEGLSIEGTVEFSIEEKIWVAKIDWDKFK